MKTVIGILAAILLAASIGQGADTLEPPPCQPEIAIRYFNFIGEGKYEAAWGLIAPGGLSGVTRDQYLIQLADFDERQKAAGMTSEKLQYVKVEKVVPDEDGKSCTIHLTAEVELQFTKQYGIVVTTTPKGIADLNRP